MDYFNNSSAHDEDSDNSNEFARVNRVMLPKSSDEYRQRRERNNAAVKKSRFKSKQKTIETQKRVDQLKKENSELDRRVETLNRELNFMRNIFVPRRDSQQLPNQQQLLHNQQSNNVPQQHFQMFLQQQQQQQQQLDQVGLPRQSASGNQPCYGSK